VLYFVSYELYFAKGADDDEGVMATVAATDCVVVVLAFKVTVVPLIALMIVLDGIPVDLAYVPTIGVEPLTYVRVDCPVDHVAVKLGTFAAAIAALCFIRRRSEKSILKRPKNICSTNSRCVAF